LEISESKSGKPVGAARRNRTKRRSASPRTDAGLSGRRNAGYADFIGLICVSPARGQFKKDGRRKQHSPIGIATTAPADGAARCLANGRDQSVVVENRQQKKPPGM
jgi:hypothetical protein